MRGSVAEAFLLETPQNYSFRALKTHQLRFGKLTSLVCLAYSSLRVTNPQAGDIFAEYPQS
jgi:hypothetical protein